MNDEQNQTGNNPAIQTMQNDISSYMKNNTDEKSVDNFEMGSRTNNQTTPLTKDVEEKVLQDTGIDFTPNNNTNNKPKTDIFKKETVSNQPQTQEPVVKTTQAPIKADVSHTIPTPQKPTKQEEIKTDDLEETFKKELGSNPSIQKSSNANLNQEKTELEEMLTKISQHTKNKRTDVKSKLERLKNEKDEIRKELEEIKELEETEQKIKEKIQQIDLISKDIDSIQEEAEQELLS